MNKGTFSLTQASHVMAEIIAIKKQIASKNKITL